MNKRKIILFILTFSCFVDIFALGFSLGMGNNASMPGYIFADCNFNLGENGIIYVGYDYCGTSYYCNTSYSSIDVGYGNSSYIGNHKTVSNAMNAGYLYSFKFGDYFAFEAGIEAVSDFSIYYDLCPVVGLKGMYNNFEAFLEARYQIIESDFDVKAGIRYKISLGNDDSKKQLPEPRRREKRRRR